MGADYEDREDRADSAGSRALVWILIPLAVVVLAIGVGIGYFFMRGSSAPPPVDSDTLRPGIPTPTGTIEKLDGTWMVDRKVGSFDDFSGSWAGYRINEQLSGIGANTAVGRTPNVKGSLVVTGTSVTSGEVEVDMTTLKSDDQRRDNRLRTSGIESDRFPTSKFLLVQPVVFDGDRVRSEEVIVDAVGKLTLHGVTRDVVVPIKARLTGDVLTLTGTIPIVLADYSISPPTAPLVLSVESTGIVEFQLHFTQTA